MFSIFKYRTEWNGTNWSEVTNAYVDNSFHSIGGGGGTVNDAHLYGNLFSNYPNRQLNSLLYDGTSWSQDALGMGFVGMQWSW